ncbi:MAG: hypothetical protein WHS82_06910 [Candidatus Methanosuratincola sp.]
MSSVMLYEETITWKFIIVLVVGVLGFAVGAMIFAYSNEPIDDPAVPISILAVVAIGIAVTLNFSRLSIRATLEGISIGFGRIRTSFRWEQIEDCYMDRASALRYGGFGIRGGRFEGKNRIVYNITNAPRLVLRVKGAKYDEFVFSTKKPDELMRVIKSQIAKPPLSNF